MKIQIALLFILTFAASNYIEYVAQQGRNIKSLDEFNERKARFEENQAFIKETNERRDINFHV